MRVINDRGAKEERPSFPAFLFFLCALLVAFGVAGVFFAPAPFLLAQLRLPEPWPKAAALMGSVFALVILRVPLPWAAFAFVVGLVFAQSVFEDRPIFSVLVRTSGTAFAAGLAMLLWSGFTESGSLDPLHAWGLLVDKILALLQETFPAGLGATGKQLFGTADWDVLRRRWFVQGPLLFLSFTWLVLWLSVGFAAHYRWTASLRLWCADALRAIALPKAVVGLFVALAILQWRLPNGTAHELVTGVFRCVAIVLFAEGTTFLSRWLHRRGVASGPRTAIYAVSVFLGFDVLIAIACVGKFFPRGLPKLRRGRVTEEKGAIG